MNWGLITNIILLSAFAVLAVFVLLGLYQWISRKSLKRVDKELLWAPLPLALMAATYFIFDKLIILNTRPNGSGEASFPSTHVMVVATIFLLASILLPKYVKSLPVRAILYAIMLTLLVTVSVGRVLADMHWISDVIGGLIFAAIFALVYYLIIKLTKGAKHAQHFHPNHQR